ncbi:MAG: hypothetical protein ACRD26_12150 [Vicinamibacterales bacterium]
MTEHTIDAPKKPYEPPCLTCYGKFKDLVQGTGGVMGDGGANMSRACWVAEVIYGVHDVRTHLIRAWLSRAAAGRFGWRMLLMIYEAVGPSVARVLPRSRILRALARPAFACLLARAVRDASPMVRLAMSLRPVA